MYGVTLASDYRFAVPLVLGGPDTDVVFTVTSEPPAGVALRGLRAVYVEGQRSDGRPHFEFYRIDGGAAVRITGAMDFYCFRDRIVCHVVDSRHQYLVEIALFGMIMSLWLELRGVTTVHASTVAMGDKAVAFMSRRGGGKTSMAAACVSAGSALLSDDLLVLQQTGDEFLAHPGFPQLRLWPDQVRHFVGEPDAHPTFHAGHDKRRVTVGEGFGSFLDTSLPLARVYELRRTDDAGADPRIDLLPPAEAMMALAQQSFLPREVVRYGLQSSRMSFFARMLQRVSIRRLTIPSGYGELPRVVSSIRADTG